MPGLGPRALASLYARQTREHQRQEGQEPARRGPKPTVSDAQLLAAIHTDLARSPFRGEGHRKVHARLRIMDGIRVARKRVLRVMRAHGLLSPHRGRQGGAPVHDGTVVTQAPNVMWGTDGVRVFTLDDGWVWIFAAVEHWNAECVGWHVCKIGSRFAALEPIAQGLGASMTPLQPRSSPEVCWRCGWTTAASTWRTTSSTRSGTGASAPASGLFEEPETNGVAERWNRTLKEQAIHGRVFQHLEDVRAAVAEFVEQYEPELAARETCVSHAERAREEYELRQAA